MTKLHQLATRETGSRKVADDYLDLVRRFPLRPLRSDREMKEAGKILDELIGRADLTTGQKDYLEGIVHFVRAYEDETVRKQLKRLTPIELVRFLMRENGMNTTDLGYVLGSRGLASEVLNEKRGLSKTLIGKLARRFQVDASLFLETDKQT